MTRGSWTVAIRCLRLPQRGQARHVKAERAVHEGRPCPVALLVGRGASAIGRRRRGAGDGESRGRRGTYAVPSRRQRACGAGTPWGMTRLIAGRRSARGPSLALLMAPISPMIATLREPLARPDPSCLLGVPFLSEYFSEGTGVPLVPDPIGTECQPPPYTSVRRRFRSAEAEGANSTAAWPTPPRVRVMRARVESTVALSSSKSP